MLDVNLTSAFLVSRAVAPDMIEHGSGKIVNVCSVMSELARPTTGAYAATKGGLKMLTRTMCAEGPGTGSRQTGFAGVHRTDQNGCSRRSRFRCVAPGPGTGGPVGRDVRPRRRRRLPLASPASDFVNGQLADRRRRLLGGRLMLVIRGATVYPGVGERRTGRRRDRAGDRGRGRRAQSAGRSSRRKTCGSAPASSTSTRTRRCALDDPLLTEVSRRA